jgi:hypothetical protein
MRIKTISWIRINLQMTSQNVWNMSLFEHFFKVLRHYLETMFRIRIEEKVGSEPASRCCGSAAQALCQQPCHWLLCHFASCSASIRCHASMPADSFLCLLLYLTACCYASSYSSFSPALFSMVLLHNGGFCNNCTPKRCLHISVHFQTNAL